MSTSLEVKTDQSDMPPQPSFYVKHFEIVSAIAQFCIASVSMMLGNKLAVNSLPLPCTVVIIQVVGTLGLLLFYRHQLQPITLTSAKTWLPIAVLFTFMLFTSLKSFVYVNVSTVLIFRNIAAIFTTITEYFVRGVMVNTEIVLSELAIIGGALMYGWGSANFSWIGFFWILANVAGQVAYGVLVKHMMEVHPQIKEMNKYSMSLFNNALALPMLALVLFAQGEHLVLAERLEAVTVGGWAAILATCFFGFLISTSGFGLQKLVTATTFLVINNLTKFFNILLGMIFLQDIMAGMLDASGCVIALGAGAWYSYASNKLNASKNAEKK